MKKIFVLATIFMLLAAGSAFAAELALTGQTGGQQMQGATAVSASGGWQDISRMSTNVVVTSQYSDTGYILNTYHTSGNKAYSSGYDSTALFWKNVGDNATLEVPTTSVSDDYFASGSGWVKM